MPGAVSPRNPKWSHVDRENLPSQDRKPTKRVESYLHRKLLSQERGGLCMQKMAVLAMIPKELGEHSRRVYKPRSLPHKTFGSFVPT